MIIVIEGADQAGKKTQVSMLQRKLRKNKIKTKTFSFPDYSTPTGRQIRAHLSGRRRPSPQLIHCLLAANRWERLDDIIRAQEQNSVIIMNRYYQSNIVYGMANGLQESWLENLDRGLPRADLVILLDITRTESFDRKKSGRDRFERDGEFLKKVISNYKRMAKKRHWKVIDASGEPEKVHKDIMRAFGARVGL